MLNKAQTALHLSVHVLSQSKRPSCCVMADHILFDVASLHSAICKVLRGALHPKHRAESSTFGSRKDRSCMYTIALIYIYICMYLNIVCLYLYKAAF